MHAGVSRLRRRAREERGARRIAFASRYLAYCPRSWRDAAARRRAPAAPAEARPLGELIPADENKPFDMLASDRRRCVDEG